MKELPYFHNSISDEEWSDMEDQHVTWGDIQNRYRQPDWCRYPDALGGIGGCWSLIYRLVDGEDFCKDCELHKAEAKP